MPSVNRNKTVFVAMSGGVDSSVAAALIKEAGYDTRGVTMSFNPPLEPDRADTGAFPDAAADAVTAARILDIPHQVIHCYDALRGHVIENFVREYARGRTPNPCVRCNERVKFGELLVRVRELGADLLATGHYARNVWIEDEKRFALKMAVDRVKDQSYFLCRIGRDVLDKVVFPLGEMTKEDVRACARRVGLNTADRPESQDVCFITGGDYPSWIRAHCGETMFTPGNFVDHTGKIVGRHKGIGCYTIGQRDKLGIALGFPAYVYAIEPDTGTIRVGPKSCLLADGLEASELCSFGLNLAQGPVEVVVRIRYHAPGVRARARLLADSRVEVLFEQPQSAVTPGQAVVFYDRDEVVGGAVIESPIRKDM